MTRAGMLRARRGPVKRGWKYLICDRTDVFETMALRVRPFFRC
jgi:hypothetical protein